MLTFKRNYLTRSLPIVVISEPKQSGGREIPNSSPTLAILPNLKKKEIWETFVNFLAQGHWLRKNKDRKKKKNN